VVEKLGTKPASSTSARRITTPEVFVTASIQANGQSIAIRTFRVTGAPVGSVVYISCRVRCDWSETKRVSAPGAMQFAQPAGRRLSRGAKIFVYVTKPGWIGYYESITVNPKRASQQLTTRFVACLPRDGKRTPISCSSATT
jgi:hypothetical protein